MMIPMSTILGLQRIPKRPSILLRRPGRPILIGHSPASQVVPIGRVILRDGKPKSGRRTAPRGLPFLRPIPQIVSGRRAPAFPRARRRPLPLIDRSGSLAKGILESQGTKPRWVLPTLPSSRPDPFRFFRKAFGRALSSTRKLGLFSAMLGVGLAAVIGLVLFIVVPIVSFPVPRGGFTLPADPSKDSALLDYAEPEGNDPLDPDSVPSVVALSASFRTKNYTVRSGDSLASIAKRFKLSTGTIISANSISSARQVTGGTNLKIPNMDGIVHKIRRGDSIGALARSYAVPVNAVLDANNLETETLRVGESLFIPGAKMRDSDLKRALGQLFIYPAYGQLSSPFGIRPDPFTGVRRFHNGIDLASPVGTRVGAAMDGRVADIGYNLVYGNYVILVHGDGFQTWYAHLSKVEVSMNQTLTQGQKVGEVGNTGYSTGSHLHFSIFRYGNPVNPLKYLN
jgi:murein DD-endopeptidase MepM/ murein hydrolase activator NlpD